MPARRVGQLALALIAVQTLFRTWGVLTGFFYEDDFRYVYDAATSGLSADYLMQDYNGHLMPGEFLLVGVLQAVAPMNFDVVAVVLLLFQVAASLTVWALLRELVGPRLGALVPLALYLFSPLTLGSFLWYAASIQAVPLQLTLAGCLLFHVRYLRRGSAKDALAGFLAGPSPGAVLLGEGAAGGARARRGHRPVVLHRRPSTPRGRRRDPALAGLVGVPPGVPGLPGALPHERRLGAP